jgi:drug/metabolite transporter (DMT)-like permease
MKAAARRDAIVLYGLLGCMVLFWSGNYVAVKIAARTLPPLLIAVLRITLAGLFILPFYFRQQRDRAKRDNWRASDAPMLLMLGAFGVVLNQVLFVVGVSLTSVAHGSMITALTPLSVLLLAAAMGMERITFAGTLGMLTAFTGVAFLQAFRGAGAAHPSMLGDALILLGGIAFAFFSVFNKRIALRRTATTVNAFAYAGSAILLAPVTVWELARHDVLHAGWAAWAAIIYMAAFSSISAYLIYSWALTRIAASQVSAFLYAQPLLAMLLGAALLNEFITLPIVLSGLLILGGIAITEHARSAREREARAAA